ncbi:hypothetical protein FRC18_004142 [Serendipita sp. 400]|nr:hypothetical protein FRC18_004142 [Serendipita sp. 400]
MRPQEPEPSHPTHPVRSYKYMKTELLGTLEANGRIRKVRVFRDPITPQEKMELEMQNKRIAAKNPKKTTKGLGPNGISKRGIEHWVWELIPVPEGKDAYEERPNLRVSSLDQLWRREIRRQGGAAGNDSKSVSSEGLQRETETSDPHKRSRAILSRSYSPEEKDRAYGDQIASQWRQVTRKNLHTPLRAKPDMPEKPQWKDFRPNPIEPDDRQSRKKSDFAIGLMDARLRQHGFHYGLPKQKELLKAANARGDHDQKKWEQQPARDFSHLSRRRQKTREEQLRHTLRSFNEIKKVTSQKRNAT